MPLQFELQKAYDMNKELAYPRHAALIQEVGNMNSTPIPPIGQRPAPARSHTAPQHPARVSTARRGGRPTRAVRTSQDIQALGRQCGTQMQMKLSGHVNKI